jgi:hypothetical protein
MNFIGRRSSNLSAWQELVSTVHRDADKFFCQTLGPARPPLKICSLPAPDPPFHLWVGR